MCVASLRFSSVVFDRSVVCVCVCVCVFVAGWLGVEFVAPCARMETSNACVDILVRGTVIYPRTETVPFGYTLIDKTVSGLPLPLMYGQEVERGEELRMWPDLFCLWVSIVFQPRLCVW